MKQVVGGTKDIVVFLPVKVGIPPFIKLLVITESTCWMGKIVVTSGGAVLRTSTEVPVVDVGVSVVVGELLVLAGRPGLEEEVLDILSLFKALLDIAED